jgi:hypothetical protein
MTDKTKQSKSYYLLGNLPIYSVGENTGAHTPNGCEFVVNTRIKYELGLCSMQFIKQEHPSLYNLDNFNPEIEVDLSSLIRLRRFIKDTPYSSDVFIQINSTKLQQKLSFQKAAFVKKSLDSLTFIMDSKKQETFTIASKFQIDCYLDLIDLCITTLSEMYGAYDLKKNYNFEETQSMVQAPVVSNIPSPIANASVVNNAGTAFNVPPAPLTSKVIVQAPPAPKL